MATPRHSSQRRPVTVERLEDRRLLTTTSNYYNTLAYNAHHEYDQFVREVQAIELQSQATPAQYLALRDDARAISEDASTTTLPPQVAASKALAVTVEIDRAPLYGSLSDQSWAEEKTHLEGDLNGLNVPQTLIDKTIADMQSVAASAGVTSDQYQGFNVGVAIVRVDRHKVPAGYGGIPDPGVFYTQHLRGFFRGWAVQRLADSNRLNADIRSISTASRASSSDAAALNRDVAIDQTIAAPVPSAINHQIRDAVIAAYSHGSPTAPTLATLQTRIVTLLGPTATPSHVSAVARLSADAPAFFRALGSSSANVATIINDVSTLVDDGSGSSLNPFRITTRYD